MDAESAKTFVEEYAEEEERSLKNGEAKLAAVVNFLHTNPFLDDENMTYQADKYPFPYEDYKDVFQYLEGQAEDRMQSGKADIFPQHLAYFNFCGTKFIWRLLIGQGSATQLILDGHDDRFPYKEEFETKL